ncbi:MAG: diacylglycerol kinase family lipid kinase [Rhodospirillaceae bacterium]
MTPSVLYAADQSDESRRVLAVFNPAAGRSRRRYFEAVVEELRALGASVSVVETEAPGHAQRIAAGASGQEFDVIAAAGGDGTINEIVNGLKGNSVALGIIPLGTANVVADEIALRRSPALVARALAHGPIKNIHVGLANNRRFVMMAGMGFDANVVNGVSLNLKKKIGPLAYIWQAVRQAFAERFTPCEVTIDGKSYQTVSLVACNGRRYGGPFIAVPQSSLNDAGFYVVLMKGRSWFSIARYGFGLLIGRISMWPDVEIVKGSEVVIQSKAGDPVQADGDIITALPVRIHVDPDPVGLIYPPA